VSDAKLDRMGFHYKKGLSRGACFIVLGTSGCESRLCPKTTKRGFHFGFERGFHFRPSSAARPLKTTVDDFLGDETCPPPPPPPPPPPRAPTPGLYAVRGGTGGGGCLAPAAPRWVGWGGVGSVRVGSGRMQLTSPARPCITSAAHAVAWR
jgi:hypothetical protein